MSNEIKRGELNSEGFLNENLSATSTDTDFEKVLIRLKSLQADYEVKQHQYQLSNKQHSQQLLREAQKGLRTLQELKTQHLTLKRNISTHLTLIDPVVAKGSLLSGSLIAIKRHQRLTEIQTSSERLSNHIKALLLDASQLQSPTSVSPSSKLLSLSSSLSQALLAFHDLFQLHQRLAQDDVALPTMSPDDQKSHLSLSHTLTSRLRALSILLKTRVLPVFDAALVDIHWPQSPARGVTLDMGKLAPFDQLFSHLFLLQLATHLVEKRVKHQDRLLSQQQVSEMSSITSPTSPSTLPSSTATSTSTFVSSFRTLTAFFNPPSSSSSSSPSSSAFSSSSSSISTSSTSSTSSSLARLTKNVTDSASHQQQQPPATNNTIGLSSPSHPAADPNNSEHDSERENDMERLWSVDRLIYPIAKKFRYHFGGGGGVTRSSSSDDQSEDDGGESKTDNNNRNSTAQKPTDRTDKPEWFFTFIRTVIQDHKTFIQNTIQGIVVRHASVVPRGLVIDVQTQFIEGLVDLISDKLRSVLPQLKSRPANLRHTVDQALAFHRWLTEQWAYPATSHSCLEVLTEESFLPKWIQVEKDYTNDRLEALRRMSKPWDAVAGVSLLSFGVDTLRLGGGGGALASLHLPVSNLMMDLHGRAGNGAVGSDGDSGTTLDLIPTHFSHAVVDLASLLTSRYMWLHNPAHRLQFVQALQTKLLLIVADDLESDFGNSLRFLQNGKTQRDLDESLSECCGQINSTHYLEAILSDWGEQTVFLDLLQFKNKNASNNNSNSNNSNSNNSNSNNINSSEEDNLWSGVIREYSGVKHRQMEKLIHAVSDKFDRYVTAEYRRTFIYDPDPVVDAFIALDVSVCMAAPLEYLHQQLRAIHTLLVPSLHRVFWTGVANAINKAMFNIVQGINLFTVGRTQQFMHDMRCLFAIFEVFTSHPSLHFKSIQDVLLLMNMPNTAFEQVVSAVSLESDQRHAVRTLGQ